MRPKGSQGLEVGDYPADCGSGKVCFVGEHTLVMENTLVMFQIYYLPFPHLGIFLREPCGVLGCKAHHSVGTTENWVFKSFDT